MKLILVCEARADFELASCLVVRRCWEETPLEELEARGRHTCLQDFLIEIRERLLPHMAGGKG